MTTTPPPPGDATPTEPAPPPPPAYPSPAYPSATPVYPSAALPSFGAPGPAPGYAYGGFWPRVLAYILDTFFVTVVEAVVTVPFVFVPLYQFYRDHPVPSGQQLPALPGDLTARFAVLGVLGAVASAVYFGGLVAWQGRTLGHRVAGLEVVRAEDGGKLPAERSFLRAIVFWGPGLLSPIAGVGTIAGLIAFVAMLSVAWDPRKQGFHDKLARAMVVRRTVGPARYVP